MITLHYSLLLYQSNYNWDIYEPCYAKTGLNDTSHSLAENSKKQQLLDVLPCISVNTPWFIS